MIGFCCNRDGSDGTLHIHRIRAHTHAHMRAYTSHMVASVTSVTCHIAAAKP